MCCSMHAPGNDIYRGNIAAQTTTKHAWKLLKALGPAQAVKFAMLRSNHKTYGAQSDATAVAYMQHVGAMKAGMLHIRSRTTCAGTKARKNVIGPFRGFANVAMSSCLCQANSVHCTNKA